MNVNANNELGESFMSDVFISYSSKDKRKALQVRETLEKNGITVWMAPDNITVGSSYPRELSNAIAECSVLVLVESENSLSSQWVLNEVLEAHNAKKKIIPFAIEKIQDNGFIFLNDVQVIDASMDNSYEMLVRTVLQELGRRTTNSIKRDQGMKHVTRLDLDSSTKRQEITLGIFEIASVALAAIGGSIAERNRHRDVDNKYERNTGSAAFMRVCDAARHAGNYENAQPYSKYGHVISLDSSGTVIRFSDGTCETLKYNDNINLREGDVGYFTILNNIIVNFESECEWEL